MSERFTGFARIRLVIELEAGSHWGGDCSVEQIHRTAAREAIEKLDRLLPGIKVIGVPVVDVVTVRKTEGE